MGKDGFYDLNFRSILSDWSLLPPPMILVSPATQERARAKSDHGLGHYFCVCSLHDMSVSCSSIKLRSGTYNITCHALMKRQEL